MEHISKTKTKHYEMLGVTEKGNSSALSIYYVRHFTYDGDKIY